MMIGKALAAAMGPKSAEAATEASKSVPPLAVAAASMGQIDLQWWMYAATIAYIGLQAAWLIWKWWRAANTKDWRPSGD